MAFIPEGYGQKILQGSPTLEGLSFFNLRNFLFFCDIAFLFGMKSIILNIYRKAWDFS